MLTYYENIIRTYNNLVTINYEFVDNYIFLDSIVASIKKDGRGTEALVSFLEDFKQYDIYIFCSNELGTDAGILDKWYQSLGFEKCSHKNMKYNVTHVKRKQ